jgi:hypothetical protein
MQPRIKIAECMPLENVFASSRSTLFQERTRRKRLSFLEILGLVRADRLLRSAGSPPQRDGRQLQRNGRQLQ